MCLDGLLEIQKQETRKLSTRRILSYSQVRKFVSISKLGQSKLEQSDKYQDKSYSSKKKYAIKAVKKGIYKAHMTIEKVN